MALEFSKSNGEAFLNLFEKFWENELSEGIISLKTLEGRKNRAKNLCLLINKYTFNSFNFIKGKIENNWPKNRDKSLSLTRVALGFRLGGQELAEKICGYIPKTETEIKKKCNEYTYYLDKLKHCIDNINIEESVNSKLNECISRMKCDGLRQKINRLICI